MAGGKEEEDLTHTLSGMLKRAGKKKKKKSMSRKAAKAQRGKEEEEKYRLHRYLFGNVVARRGKEKEEEHLTQSGKGAKGQRRGRKI